LFSSLPVSTLSWALITWRHARNRQRCHSAENLIDCVEIDDRGAGNAKSASDPLAFQYAHCRIYRSHLHLMIPLGYELA
ncbi:hypothetical protein, partial [Bradyrhizobium uaiense]|uniref:hypothetical protein n=1 Tax=Bradyrhizobium uaiense TaxID=2594946 RepID=UPI0019D573CF